MTNLIRKLFIKDYQNTDDPVVRAKHGTVAGAVGIVTNLLLAGGKILLGVLFGAIAIVADGINNLADSLSSIITLIGFRLSAQQADQEHPYGHGRMEYIAAMIISMLTVVVGFTLVQESFPKIFAPQEAASSPLIWATLLLSIAIKLWQGLFYRKMGKAIASDALRANFRDSINDVISTSTVLLSILLTPLIGYNTDGVMGTAVALFIMYSGVMLLKETIQPLLGEGADAELAARIKDQVLSYPGVLGVHDLIVHNYGPGRAFASVHVEVAAQRDLLESHDLIDNIERELYAKLGLQLTIHMDPIVTNDPELDALRAQLQEILLTIDPQITFHDLRLVRGNTHSNLLFDVVVPFGFRYSDDQIKQQIDRAVRNLRPDFFTVIAVDKDMTKH